MKTIKVIDLINGVAKGEDLPKTIKYLGYTLHEVGNDYECDTYMSELNSYNLFIGIFYRPGICLNDSVEIIEEDEKIEELSYKYINTYGNISQHRKSEEPLIDKINQLVKAVNKLNDKSE